MVALRPALDLEQTPPPEQEPRRQHERDKAEPEKRPARDVTIDFYRIRDSARGPLRLDSQVIAPGGDARERGLVAPLSLAPRAVQVVDAAARRAWPFGDRADERPVAIVFREPTKALVRIEE